MDMELDLDPEFTPQHDLRWDMDGTGAGDGVDPKLRLKSYNPNMDPEQDPDLELTPSNIWLLFCTHMVIKTWDGSSCITV